MHPGRRAPRQARGGHGASEGRAPASLPPEAERLLRARRPEWSAPPWALRFAASQTGALTVLSGTSAIGQVEENTAAMADFSPLTEEETETAKSAVRIIAEANPIPCTACGHCEDSRPQRIAIPNFFWLYNAEKQALNRGFSTQRIRYRNFAQRSAPASACAGCRACEGACPQRIRIPDELQKVARLFE